MMGRAKKWLTYKLVRLAQLLHPDCPTVKAFWARDFGCIHFSAKEGTP